LCAAGHRLLIAEVDIRLRGLCAPGAANEHAGTDKTDSDHHELVLFHVAIPFERIVPRMMEPQVLFQSSPDSSLAIYRQAPYHSAAVGES
jgi:hypothetical protein